MKEYRVDNVVIHSIERLKLSANGNPRFRMYTSRGTFHTESDASLGYSIENYTNSRYPETFIIGNPDDPKVTLLMRRARQVFAIERDGNILR